MTNVVFAYSHNTSYELDYVKRNNTSLRRILYPTDDFPDMELTKFQKEPKWATNDSVDVLYL